MRFDIYVQHLTIHYLPFLLLKALNKNLPSPTIFFFVVEHNMFSNLVMLGHRVVGPMLGVFYH